jgi:hypothetical protein
MMRPALDVPDTVALELGLELGGTTPTGVLPTLVGQDLARRPIIGNAAGERLQYQAALLVMRQCQTHQIARVVVQERRHVHPLVLAQQEREQVRLPQLVRLGTLEALQPRLTLDPRLDPRRCQPLLLQHPPYRGRRGPQPKVALKHIPDPATPRGRLRTLHRHDRRHPRRHHTARLLLPPPGHRQQPRRAAFPVLAAPLQHRRVRHPEPRRHLMRAQPLVHHRTRRRQTYVPRPRTSPRRLRSCLPLGCHLSAPRLPSRQANSATSAKGLPTRSSAHVVVRTARYRGRLDLQRTACRSWKQARRDFG